jgi:hypothetical protein
MYQFRDGTVTNLGQVFLNQNDGPYAVYSSESGKYAVATSDNSGGFLRDGLSGENYAPTPFPNHRYVNVQGITERYTFGSSFFSEASHSYSEVAYIYDHITRTRYDLNPNNYESDKRRTTAMNEVGQAVVEFFPGPNQYSYSDVEQCELWQNGQRKIIGQMANAKINEKGHVIGRILDLNNPNLGQVQFYDGVSTQMFDLPDGNATSLSDDDLALVTFSTGGAFTPSKLYDVKTRTAYDLHAITSNMPAGMIAYHGLIRADGTIAAIGTENGKSYLLKFTPVPEPTSLFVLGLGAMVLLRKKR